MDEVMIMCKKLIILIVLFLIVSNYSMSDDGNQEPNKITIKDQFGIDTGMSQKELDEFKNQYFEFVKKSGLLDKVIVSPKYRDQITEEYYNNKLNLNKIDKLKKLKLFSAEYDNDKDLDFAYMMSSASVILIGKRVGKEHFFETKEEEWATKPGISKSRYLIEVEEILKGDEWFVEEPDTIGYLSSVGKFLTDGSMDFAHRKKYLIFLKPANMKRQKNGDFYGSSRRAIRIEENGTYYYGSKYYFSLDEMRSKIKNFIEINDSENFYRRKYK